MEETPIAFLRSRLATMKTERQSFEPQWRESAEFGLPRRGRWFEDNNPSQQGKKKNQRIINSTCTKAVRTFKAGFMSSHTSPARPWFRFMTPDPDMMEFAAVKQYLFQVEQRMRDVLNKSNFYTAQPSVLEEWGFFGQCPMLCQEDMETVVRFYPYTVGSYYLAANERGTIDTFAREFKMTVRNMVRQFGKDRLQPNTRMLCDTGRLDDWIDVVQFICPNSDMEYGRHDARGMPFASRYFESSCDPTRDQFLGQAGFREYPVVCPRWDVVTPEDVYGNSIMSDVLGDVKQLQFNERRKAAGIDKLADPQWVGVAGMKNVPINGLPGGVTWAASAADATAFRPAYEYPYQGISVIGAENQIVQQRIREGFFEDLLLMLSMYEGPQMTAEEIIRRQEEKVNAIGPYLTRLNSEQLDPMLDRVFELIVRHPDRLLPPPPRELEGVTLKVDYISALAQAQRMVGGGVIERFASFMGSMAQINGGVLDKWDMDQTIDQYANVYGVPPDMVRSDDQVAELRQQRQQQEQMAQMAAMAAPVKDAAQAAQSLSASAPTADSILGRAGQAAAAAQGMPA